MIKICAISTLEDIVKAGEKLENMLEDYLICKRKNRFKSNYLLTCKKEAILKYTKLLETQIFNQRIYDIDYFFQNYIDIINKTKEELY